MLSILESESRWIPDELVHEILFFVIDDPFVPLTLRLVNRQFSRICLSNSLWRHLLIMFCPLIASLSDPFFTSFAFLNHETNSGCGNEFARSFFKKSLPHRYRRLLRRSNGRDFSSLRSRLFRKGILHEVQWVPISVLPEDVSRAFLGGDSTGRSKRRSYRRRKRRRRRDPTHDEELGDFSRRQIFRCFNGCGRTFLASDDPALKSSYYRCDTIRALGTPGAYDEERETVLALLERLESNSNQGVIKRDSEQPVFLHAGFCSRNCFQKHLFRIDDNWCPKDCNPKLLMSTLREIRAKFSSDQPRPRLARPDTLTFQMMMRQFRDLAARGTSGGDPLGVISIPDSFRWGASWLDGVHAVVPEDPLCDALLPRDRVARLGFVRIRCLRVKYPIRRVYFLYRDFRG